MLQSLIRESLINRAGTVMSQTQSLPRQSWEGGTRQHEGATCINNSGCGGQWSIPMPAECHERRGASGRVMGWLQEDGDPAVAF